MSPQGIQADPQGPRLVPQHRQEQNPETTPCNTKHANRDDGADKDGAIDAPCGDELLRVEEKAAKEEADEVVEAGCQKDVRC